MAWIMDTYSQQVGFAVPGVVTENRFHWAAAWVVKKPPAAVSCMCTLEALRHLGISIQNTCVAIQGFGNVGSHTARIMHQEGAQGHRRQRCLRRHL